MVAEKDCPDPSTHGHPFRYCPSCDWREEQPATAELSVAERPCGVCCLHAMSEGVPYDEASGQSIVGSKYGDDKVIHQAVTTIRGTDVCWYHVQYA